MFIQTSMGSGGIGVPSSRRVPLAAGLLLFGASGALLAAGGLPDGMTLGSGVMALFPVFAVGYARAGGLDHPTRIRIYNHLLTLPGDHFRSIVRTLSIGIGEGRHHLDVMLRNGLVRESKTNGRCRYYAEGQGPASERNDLFAKHWGFRDLRLRVLFAVRNLGDAKPSGVARALGISRQLAAYHLRNLEELGLVTREGRSYRAS